jgi:hypothetical protein
MTYPLFPHDALSDMQELPPWFLLAHLEAVSV